MLKPNPVREALLTLLEEADHIIAKRKMYGLKKKIPKSSDKDFVSQDDSFGEVVRQGVNPQDFNEWYAKLEIVFIRFGMQIDKFKRKADSFDPTTESNTPAMTFLRRVAELEKMTESTEYLNLYFSPSVKPVITYENGVLAQGGNSHRFTKKPHRDMLKLLWDDRGIVNGKGATLKQPKPTARKEIEFRLDVAHDKLEGTARAITKGAKDANITLAVRYPKGVYLELVQDSK